MMDEEEQEGLLGKVDRWIRVENTLARQALAEFLGSFVLIMIGNGAVAEVVLSSGSANNFFSINIAYGLAVAFGMYISVGISGGHLNPAISVTFCCLGKLQWRRLPAYLGAQYLGCLFGSALVFGIYYDALVHLDGGRRITDPALPNATAGIWASYPQPHISWQNGFVDQIFVTCFLMIVLLALLDENNLAPPKGTAPIMIGLLVMVLGMSYGYNCGYPINPARDLAPRIFTALAGWGDEPFSHRNYSWFWVPVVGPHFGAILGAIMYQSCIGSNWPPANEGKMESVTLEMDVQPRVTFVENAAYERPRNGARNVRSRTIRQGERYTQS